MTGTKKRSKFRRIGIDPLLTLGVVLCSTIIYGSNRTNEQKLEA